MPDYITFNYGGIPKPSGDALRDAADLIRDCFSAQLSNEQDKFPLKLLILLASPAFFKEQNNLQYISKLLDGIQRTLSPHREVPLIGSSVAGVFYGKEIHADGALLICLSSQLIDVLTAYGEDARNNPEPAVKLLLSKLKIDSKNIDPNPLANKLIMTFLPGCNQDAVGEAFYPAPSIHKLIYKGVNARIMITGGVSSLNDLSRRKDGYQFFGKKILQNSVVAASITTGVPIGVGLNDALISTGDILSIVEVGDDGRTISAFADSRNAYQRLNQIGVVGKDLMLAKMSSDDERTLDLPWKETVKNSVSLLRQIEPNDHFEVLKPDSSIFKTFKSGIKQSKGRVMVEKPIVASFLLVCKSYRRFHDNKILNIETALTQIEALHRVPCVGGFFDGEIGVDDKGRSRMTNGSISYITFGDEMRERTSLYKGVSALAQFGSELLSEKDPKQELDDTIGAALNIISETGFPGAMLSLIYSNLDRKTGLDDQWIIAKRAVGTRFPKIVKLTKRHLKQKDILSNVVKKNTSQFINQSAGHPDCDPEAVGLSGTISQYVLPLRKLDKSVFGVLQIDVGDLQKLKHDFHKTEKAKMMDSFAKVIGANLNHMAGIIENKIMLDIDKALSKAMLAERFYDGLQIFIDELKETFGTEMGHIWLTDADENSEKLDNQALFLIAGFGKFFNAIKKKDGKHQAKKDTPVFIAYLDDCPHIINNLKEDPIWQTTCADRENREHYKELLEIQSYIAAKFESKDKKVLGVISFGSNKPWFFLEFHQKAMKVLADRLHFLVEHLKTKIHHNFLLEVSPKLTALRLKDTQEILDKVTNTFCANLDGHFAALYLLNENKQKYVLRSGVNWRDTRWIHAASYQRDVNWIGFQTEKNIPIYEPDLHKYYQENNYQFPGGRYADHMFGQSLSDNFTVEVIVLPLQIDKYKLGVLTVYRQIEKGQSSGFITKNIDLLQEGAFQAAGLINTVIQHRKDTWGKNETHRRQKVYQALNSTSESESIEECRIDEKLLFEAEVCRQILKEYNAAEVAFYQIDASGAVGKHYWIAGFRSDNNDKIIENTTDNLENYSLAIRSALHTCDKTVAVNRCNLDEEDFIVPQSLKMEGRVNETYIPLLIGKEILAALIIRWNLNPDESFLPEVQSNINLLVTLGRIIASRYRRNQLTITGDQTTLALQATAAYAVQRAHLLRNTMQKISDLSGDLKKDLTKIKSLTLHIRTAMKIVKETTVLGKRVLYPSCREVRLSEIIDKVFKVNDGALEKKFENLKIKYPYVDNKIIIKADTLHTKDALYNLFDNAANSISEKIRINKMSESPNIFIELSLERDQKIKMVINDNGLGMTKKQMFNAKRGFVRTKDHTGVGVLIAYVLLAAQGASLSFESEKFVGTRAILILPSVEMEQINENE